jgi:Resolvase, N terminal domain
MTLSGFLIGGVIPRHMSWARHRLHAGEPPRRRIDPALPGDCRQRRGDVRLVGSLLDGWLGFLRATGALRCRDGEHLDGGHRLHGLWHGHAEVTSKPAPSDIVVVHSVRRFFRDHFELEFYVRKLAKNGVKLVSIPQEMGDDPMHVMMRQIMALFDEYQSKENAKHVLRAMNENAWQAPHF